ncbi:ABC transporter ATP-binding protein [Acuticoccus kandeliae]|uniref:ABC transporter ATP-binding protein n=1 Tax=Acuticoccus kandeliae TaxID=2073160 RepID=UPI00196AA43E|nr:ABC transporter ATP-binding protein [Acuticoccus kandeliae]
MRKTFATAKGPIEALANVDLDVRPGEFVSILGPSGCGKSTLLMAVAGLEATTDGVVEISHRPIDGPRRETAVVFQDATLLPWRSALQNVLYPAQIARERREVHEPRARALLSRVGLAGFEDHRPGQLSGGMRQRVALCRALVQEPDLLLMDEPFSALDAITRDEMVDLMLSLWDEERGCTAIFVTHSIHEAALLSDRVVVMRRAPCEVLADITVPFARPRRMSIVDEPEFVALCSKLRRLIEVSMGRRDHKDV